MLAGLMALWGMLGLWVKAGLWLRQPNTVKRRGRSHSLSLQHILE